MTWSRAMRLRALYLLISLFLRLELSRGVLVNRTIDDQIGDSVTGVLPVYEGTSWKQGATCTSCVAQPDPSFAFQGTWHDATWTPGDPSEDIMSVSFTGSAVYVFIILANSVPFVMTLTSLSFTLDGELVGSFVHTPTTSADYEYNVTAYANDTLANAQHTLFMQTAGDNQTLVLFDYVIYSVNDEVTTSSPTSSSSPPLSPSPSLSQSSSPIKPTSTTSTSSLASTSAGKNTKTIVGVTVGGIVVTVVALAICLLLCWYKRRNNIISVFQVPSNDVANGEKPLNGQPKSSHWKGASSEIRLTMSVPMGTYTNMLSHHDQCGVFLSTMELSSQDPSSSMAEYAHSTADAKPSEGVCSNHGLESRAHYKSAEKQLHLFRQIEQMVLNARSRQEMRVGSISHSDNGGARALQGRVVDEAEHLHAQHGSNANAGSLGADNEPPPDYSSRGRGSYLSQIG